MFSHLFYYNIILVSNELILGRKEEHLMLDEILYRFSQVLGVDLDENSNIVLLIPKFSHLSQLWTNGVTT